MSTTKPYLSIGPYRRRGPTRIRGPDPDPGSRTYGKVVTLDHTDGWASTFKTHNVKGPYTIYQNIERIISWSPDHPDDPSPVTSTFTEVWPYSRTGVLDAFLVPRAVYRIQARGTMLVKASAWVLPGRQQLESQGFRRGEVGDEPWGNAYGRMGFTKPPRGTRVLVRTFKAFWDNRNGPLDTAISSDPATRKLKSHYYRGDDMQKGTLPVYYYDQR